jgi:hypothetical protein
MSELHIHERINNALNILNSLTLTGFQQFNAVSTVMKELAALDRDIAKAEQEEKKEPEVKLEVPPDEQTCETD